MIQQQMTRAKLAEVIENWSQAWNKHDLDGVMTLFHADVVFENWTGATVRGKNALRQAWQPWFQNHGHFKFITEDVFVDASCQKVLYQWTLEWPSFEAGYAGKWEIRRGVDVIHFREGKIISKQTYCKTSIEIDTQRICLTP